MVLRAEFGRALILWEMGCWVRGAGLFSGERRWLRCRSGEDGGVVKHVFLIGEESNMCFGDVNKSTRAWGKA